MTNLTNVKIGRLTVIKLAYRTNKRAFWECVCDCGNVRIIEQYGLKKHRTQSCGCLRSELLGDRSRTHGMTNDPTYYVWKSMKDRCYRQSSEYWSIYGGRGITVCDRWLHSFENFIADMGQRPFPKAQIDRIDNNGNYSPDNCRWATPSSNQRNKNNNAMVTYLGETHCLADWADKTGISYSVLRDRRKLKWDVTRMFTQPIQIHPKRKVTT